MRTAAILPVKRFAHAKSRLGASVADPLRGDLARAMVGDVLTALSEVASLQRTIVVTSEPTVAAAASYLGALVVPDTAEDGQSAAVALGVAAAMAAGYERVLCIPGDCPALDPAEVDALLVASPPQDPPPRDPLPRDSPPQDSLLEGSPPQDSSPQDSPPQNSPEGPARGVTIVPDRHGAGTNGLLLAPGDAIAPSFGPGSCERHERLTAQAGVACRIQRPASLLLDIDTGEDLAALRERLAGERVRAPRTRAVLGLAEEPWLRSRPAA